MDRVDTTCILDIFMVFTILAYPMFSPHPKKGTDNNILLLTIKQQGQGCENTPASLKDHFFLRRVLTSVS